MFHDISSCILNNALLTVHSCTIKRIKILIAIDIGVATGGSRPPIRVRTGRGVCANRWEFGGGGVSSMRLWTLNERMKEVQNNGDCQIDTRTFWTPENSNVPPPPFQFPGYATGYKCNVYAVDLRRFMGWPRGTLPAQWHHHIRR